MANQEPHVSSYEKGMHKDLNVESLPANAYEDAQNFRLFTSGDGASLGGIQNVKGTKLVHNLPEGERIIGSTQLRDALIIFTAQTSGTEGQAGKIYKVEFNFQNETIDVNLIYEAEGLKFSAAYPIEALAIFETRFIQRVYFSDFQNPTRVINIADPNVQDLPVGSLSMFPKPPVKKPNISTVLGGGALPSGLYQYTYYLVTPGGQKTTTAPPSYQIHITTDSEETGDTSGYNGDFTTPGETINSGKAVIVDVDTSTLTPGQYETIVFVAIHIPEFGAQPILYEFDNRLLTEDSIISVTHTGSEEIGDIPFEEFITERYAFYTNKTFSAKDNILFVGNVKTPSFVLSPETASGLLTKRYKSDQSTYSDPYKNPFNDETGIAYGDNLTGDYEFWAANYQYMFQQDGTTIGGQSQYVRYKFTLEQQWGSNNSFYGNIPNSGGDYDYSLVPGITDTNKSFRNFASPYTRFLRGYKRGETYRFGLVFYSKVTGDPSPVYYIGDIKFPEMSQRFGTEMPGGEMEIINPENLEATGEYFDHYAVSKKVPDVEKSVLYTLGIQFDFNFPAEITDNISHFQVVRTKRTETDKTRLAQGVVNKYYNMNVSELLQANGGPNAGDRWDNESIVGTNILLCPIAEMTSVYGHLNRYSSHNDTETDGGQERRGEEGKYGLGHIFPNITEPMDAGYDNGDPFSWYVYYQSMFSTSLVLSFYSPEISYEYNIPGFNQGQDYFKTVGLFADTFKQQSQGSGFGPNRWGSIKRLRPFEVPELTGYQALRPYLGSDSYNQGQFFKFETYNSVADSEREFKTIARSTDRLDKLGIPNAPIPAHLLSQSEEKIRGWRILTGREFRRQQPFNVEGLPIFKTAFETGNPFGYFTFQSRLGKDGKSLVAVLDGDIRNADDFFTKGRFVGKTLEFDAQNNPDVENGFNVAPSFDYDEPGEGNAFIVDYVRKLNEQYGGVGEDAVSLNTFITCSDPIPAGITTTKVFQGDIFVCMYEFMKNFWNNDYSDGLVLGQQGADPIDQAWNGDNSSTYEVVTIPVETTVNIELGSGTRFSEGARLSDELYRTQEYPSNPPRYNDTTGGRNRLFFEYDPVYSEEQVSKAFIPLPVGQPTPEVNFDVRTYYSGTKLLGENLDSWSQFGLFNFKDIDTQYGPLNRLINFKDEIFGFQDNAVVSFQINTRELIASEQGAPLTLGTGAGIQDYIYLSTQYGSINQYGILKTDNAIYFLDANRKKFFAIAGKGVTDISEAKGLNDYLRTNITGLATLTRDQGGDNPLLGVGSHLGYDPINKEVLITVLGNKKGYNLDTNYGLNNAFIGNGFSPETEIVIVNGQLYTAVQNVQFYNELSETFLELAQDSTITPLQPLPTPVIRFTNSISSLYRATDIDGFTAVFSEPLIVFSSFYDQLPVHYAIGSRKVLSPDPQSQNKLHLLDSGDYGKFFGMDPKDSSITITVNKQPLINKILRFVEYNSIVKDNEAIIQELGLSAIRVYNDYQDSGIVQLDPRQKRRFRKWRVKLPRDQKSNNQLGRFRGTYFNVTFYFDNSVNLSLMLERIVSHFDIQMY